MQNFISINDVRIHKSTIKKYAPNGESKLNLYYSPSRNRMDVETFTFDSEKERDKMLETLDTIL